MDIEWDLLLAHWDAELKKGQYIKDHARNTAEYMARIGKSLGLESVCILIGLLHDAGKVNRDWQKYIRGEAASGGDHSGVGACYVQYVLYKYAKNSVPADTYRWYGIYNEFLIYPILARCAQGNGRRFCLLLDRKEAERK